MNTDNKEELLPIVDEQGNVVGKATRGECHGGTRQLHPVVHLHVRDASGRLYLQKRPEWKDIQPGKWDTAVGGHVDYGEEICDALVREAREELGLTGFKPQHVRNYVFESARERELVNVFTAVVDADSVSPSEELDGGRFWDIAEIEAAIGNGILTPNFESEYQTVLKPFLKQNTKENPGDSFRIFSAPLQGYTDVPWRHFHAEQYGGVDTYFTPFIRVERGEVRQRDLKALSSPLNDNTRLIPQIIFRDSEEFVMLVDAVRATGFNRIDLNMGCPYPPQVNHGRGSTLLTRPELLEEILELMADRYSNVRFSVKMRLGVKDPDDWRQVLPVIDCMPLTHVTVHPRVAVQQYAGELYMDSFAELLAQSVHPVIFNGDLMTRQDIDRVTADHPAVAGVMIGRGLLSDPALAMEWRDGADLPSDERLRRLLEFHRLLLEHYVSTVSGEGQVLQKIKPLWDYLEPVIGHKGAKAIRKATSLAKYHAAVRAIR